MFDCILTVHELERHGWLFTYHIWVIWVCRTWLIVYLSYTIMEKCLIVYFPCMNVEDMVDYALTIYEWYISLWYMTDCVRTVIDYGVNVLLYIYRAWAWKTVSLPYRNDKVFRTWGLYAHRLKLRGIFYCILTTYDLGRHGWLCTYHIWEMWVCRTRLIVYISYSNMEKCLIIY